MHVDINACKKEIHPKWIMYSHNQKGFVVPRKHISPISQAFGWNLKQCLHAITHLSLSMWNISSPQAFISLLSVAKEFSRTGTFLFSYISAEKQKLFSLLALLSVLCKASQCLTQGHFSKSQQKHPVNSSWHLELFTRRVTSLILNNTHLLSSSDTGCYAVWIIMAKYLVTKSDSVETSFHFGALTSFIVYIQWHSWGELTTAYKWES